MKTTPIFCLINQILKILYRINFGKGQDTNINIRDKSNYIINMIKIPILLPDIKEVLYYINQNIILD